MDMVFYRCPICGQIVAIVKKTGVPLVCCGKPMQEIVPGTTDASLEKHVPVYEVKDGKVFVKIGSVPHPMADDHYINFTAVPYAMTSAALCITADEEKRTFTTASAPKA